MRRLFLVACAAVLLTPARAGAEWHFTPMGGYTMFGNTSFVDPEQGTGKRHLHAGGSVAWLSRGIFGLEALGIWTPEFFEGKQSLLGSIDAIDSSRTVSLMGNVVLTLPQRWTEYGLRPFVSGGWGLLHSSTRSARSAGGALAPGDVFTFDVNLSGFNVGGGAIGFISPRTGVRFDVRYHSTLRRTGDAPSFGPAHLRYMTASLGVVLRR